MKTIKKIEAEKRLRRQYNIQWNDHSIVSKAINKVRTYPTCGINHQRHDTICRKNGCSNVISFQDFFTAKKEIERILKQRTDTQRYRHNRIKKMTIKARNNPKYLGLLLHTANKYAKKYRDSQEILVGMIYEDTHCGLDISGTHHNILHAAKDAKNNLYDIKTRVLEWTQKKKIGKYGKWHSFTGFLYAREYSFGGFSFHECPMSSEELEDKLGKKECKKIINNAKNLGTISAETNRKMPNIYDVQRVLNNVIAI